MIAVTGIYLDVKFMGNAVAELVRGPQVVEVRKKLVRFFELFPDSSLITLFLQGDMQKLIRIHERVFGVRMGMDFPPLIPEKPDVTFGKTPGSPEKEVSDNRETYR